PRTGPTTHQMAVPVRGAAGLRANVATSAPRWSPPAPRSRPVRTGRHGRGALVTIRAGLDHPDVVTHPASLDVLPDLLTRP
ncbi:hypothetical protein, partial [Modestobacter altitudinis]|uniref:hypothetical protein n=1 Tax=Modestobacter altitudinis TaxID=2213158 RepID=UPI001C553C7A